MSVSRVVGGGSTEDAEDRRVRCVAWVDAVVGTRASLGGGVIRGTTNAAEGRGRGAFSRSVTDVTTEVAEGRVGRGGPRGIGVEDDGGIVVLSGDWD